MPNLVTPMKTIAMAVVIIALGAAPAFAEHALDGTWSFNVTTSAGSGTATLKIMVDGNAITGTYSGQVGQADLTGTVDGDKVEIHFDADLVGTVSYMGTLSGGTIKGTCEYGALGEGTFEATKN